MSLRILKKFFSPNFLLIYIEKPTAKPKNIVKSSKSNEYVAPTAPTAKLFMNLPAIIESNILYDNDKSCDNTSGIANKK